MKNRIPRFYQQTNVCRPHISNTELAIFIDNLNFIIFRWKTSTGFHYIEKYHVDTSGRRVGWSFSKSPLNN